MCVKGAPSGVLSGEVCRVTVEVVNCGQVPLNSLRLTSSAGGALLLDPVSCSLLPLLSLSPLSSFPSPLPLSFSLPSHSIYMYMYSTFVEESVAYV